jgi:hypothetical protein
MHKLMQVGTTVDQFQRIESTDGPKFKVATGARLPQILVAGPVRCGDGTLEIKTSKIVELVAITTERVPRYIGAHPSVHPCHDSCFKL